MNTTYINKFRGRPEEFGCVAVLFGGVSAEREISLASGKAVLEGLLSSGVDAFGVDIGHDLVRQLSTTACDRVFIALHGIGGEDGKVQAILESLNIPYTGSNMASSSLAMDKLKTKLVWQGVDLPTPAFEILDEYPEGEERYQTILQTLDGGCFVKPVTEGSSLGMCLAATSVELKEAHRVAARFNCQIIAEKQIVGKEYTVAILNGQVLPTIELRVRSGFYDYDAKYLSNQTEYLCPCELDAVKQTELNAIALKAYELIGCKSWGRVDFMQDSSGDFFLLEVNTVPGMTSHSLVPMAAKNAGLSFNDLLLEILSDTLEVNL